MNPLFKLSTAVVALGIVLGFAAGPLRAAPEGPASLAPSVEIKVDDGAVRRRVPTSVHSSGVVTISYVRRVKLHPHYVEVFYNEVGNYALERTVVFVREDFLDLSGKPRS